MRRNWLIGLAAAAICVGCGGKNDTAPTSDTKLTNTPAKVAAAPEMTSAGSLTVTVDGKTKRFDYLPARHNVYRPIASSIKAKPSADMTEVLTIVLMSIDLGKLDYPTQLPALRTPGEPMNAASAMASVGFGYIDEQGREWAGPGQINIESFGSDGVLEGTFADVSLPHTDKQLPNVNLANGHVIAQIGGQ